MKRDAKREITKGKERNLPETTRAPAGSTAKAVIGFTPWSSLASFEMGIPMLSVAPPSAKRATVTVDNYLK